jgi:predicted transcriptional regulator of viral defense system
MKKDFSTLSDYIEYLQSRGQYIFERKKAMDLLQMTDNAFKKAAKRLVKKARIKRIRAGFYTIIPIEYKASGSLPASWFIHQLMQYLAQPYYCGLLTAAALLGAAHQQPMIFQVITAKQMRPIEVGQLRIEFIYKKTIQTYFYKPIKTATGYMNVSTPEMTAFDLMRYMRVAGHIHHVATVLCELVAELKPQQLAYLVAQGDVAVIDGQRLGYLLDVLGLSIDLKPLEQALKSKKLNQRLLVTDGDQTILEKNQRWQILINESVEPDEL